MRYFADRSRTKGTGKRTLNARLVAAKSFTKWLVTHGRLAADPLAAAKRLRESDDRRRVRRTLTADEFDRLIRAAEGGPVLWGISGPDRAMLYRVLAGTGLRRSCPIPCRRAQRICRRARRMPVVPGDARS